MFWIWLFKTANGFNLFDKVFPNDSHHVWFDAVKRNEIRPLDAEACRLAVLGNIHAHDVKIIFSVKVRCCHDNCLQNNCGKVMMYFFIIGVDML